MLEDMKYFLNKKIPQRWCFFAIFYFTSRQKEIANLPRNVRPLGLEPRTFWSEARHSIH